MNPRSARPTVSVVLTTVDRSRLVQRAAHSALSQTLEDVEVIVVIDGGSPAVQEALGSIEDDRLRVRTVPERRGQSSAINLGVEMARGTWIALLDDDDEWMPAKLERQLELAEALPGRRPVVGCRFIARREKGESLWPRRGPGRDEPICEYLFCRRGLTFGEGILPTSMIFCPADLLREVPMDEKLARHCDLDWLLRCGARDDVSFCIDPGGQPLAVWDISEERDRMSNQHDWRYSRDWIAARRELVTERAYAGFLLTWVSFSARCEHDRPAFVELLAEARERGRPNLSETLAHIATWWLPMGLRSGMARRLGRLEAWQRS